jgi:hypothetical protein
MDDCFKRTWLTGLNPEKLVKEYLKFGSERGFKDQNNADNVWFELSEDIKSVPKKLFQWEEKVESFTNKEKQKEYLLSQIRKIVTWFISNHWWWWWWWWSFLSMYNATTLDIWTDLNEWWLNIAESFAHLSASQIKKWSWDAAILKAVDNIIYWRNRDISANIWTSKKLHDILG